MNFRSITSLLFLFVIQLSCIGNTDTERDLEESLRIEMTKASELYHNGEYLKAASVLNTLISQANIDDFKYEKANIYYNLSCYYALSGEKESAIHCLEEAVQSGYANAENMMKDDDLKSIRQSKRFSQLINQLTREEHFWENEFLNTEFKLNISENEKIAGLSKLWSEIKFNFINFDLVPGINIDSLYMIYLPKIRNTSSTLEYYQKLQEFCSHLIDGHTEIKYPKELRHLVRGRVPIQTRLISGQVIITKVYDKDLLAIGIKPGVELTHIDGQDVHAYAEQHIKPYWTTNSPHGRDRTVYEYALLRGPVGTTVRVKCHTSDQEDFQIELRRLKRINVKWEPVVYRKLDQNIGYLNIKSFYDDEIVTEIDSLFNQIMQTDALIIDLRENGGGNGRVGWKILGYFTNHSFEIFQWKTRLYRPIWRAWGRREELYVEKPAFRYADDVKYYSKPVVLLTRARTGSMAENFCIGFRIMNRGKIIGGPTMGSSGTPLFFSLPGGGKGQVVTTRSFYPDGSDFIGQGVKPDIEVYPTVLDFRQGKDRILDRAVEYLTRNQ